MAQPSQEIKAAIVGTGRAGLGLARAFSESEIPVVVISRSRRRQKRGEPPILTIDHPRCPRQVPFVLLAVPDAVIPEAARAMRDAGVVGPRSRVGHLSGALPSAVLEPIIPADRVFSAHPLTAFPPALLTLLEPGISRVVVMVEAPEATTLRAVMKLFRRTGATVAPLDPDRKPLYHAGAVVGTTFPYLNLMMCATILKECGVPDPFRVAGDLLDDAIDNLQITGDMSGLTGPFARGDVDTIASNLRSIEAFSKEYAELYRVQGRIVTRWLRESGQLGQESWEAILKIVGT